MGNTQASCVHLTWGLSQAVRQVLTKEEPGIWQKLSPNMQKIVKEQLLEGIKGEKDRSLNKKVPICTHLLNFGSSAATRLWEVGEDGRIASSQTQRVTNPRFLSALSGWSKRISW
jgi:hypothetical protein